MTFSFWGPELTCLKSEKTEIDQELDTQMPTEQAGHSHGWDAQVGYMRVHCGSNMSSSEQQSMPCCGSLGAHPTPSVF